MKWRDASAVIVAARTAFGATSAPSNNYRVLTGQRASKSSFLPDGFVFPGGLFEPEQDAAAHWTQLFDSLNFKNLSLDTVRETHPGKLSVFRRKGLDEVLERRLSLRIGAVRETWEECGVLLCRRHDGATRFGNTFVPAAESKQKADETFFEMCARLECFPDVWALREARNWLTPAFFPKRFDTVFFVCCLDHTPPVNIDQLEISDYKWESPSDYLAMHKSGQLSLPPPQLYEFHVMNELTGGLEALEAAAAAGHLCGHQCFLPVKFRLKDGAAILLPSDSGYEVREDGADISDFKDCTIADFRQKSEKLHRFEMSAKGKPSFVKNH